MFALAALARISLWPKMLAVLACCLLHRSVRDFPDYF